MSVSGGQQRDSATHIHVSILPQIPPPSRLSHNSEQGPLCCRVGPCWLSIPNIAVGTCTMCPSQTPRLPLALIHSPLATVRPFFKSMSLFLLCKQVHLYHFFLGLAYKGCHKLFLLLPLTYAVTQALFLSSFHLCKKSNSSRPNIRGI